MFYAVGAARIPPVGDFVATYGLELEGKAFRSVRIEDPSPISRIYDAAARLTNGESSILAPRSGNWKAEPSDR